MKNKIIKRLAVCLSIAISATGLPISSIATAEENPPDFTMYACTGDDRKDTVYVSTEELAKGDVTIPVDVYTISEEWTDPYINYMYFIFDSSDWNAIRFTNPFAYARSPLGEQTYTYSGGTFTSKLEPYMLSSLTERRGTLTYMRPNCSVYSTQYAADPIFGMTLYSDGNGGAYFSATYAKSLEDKENGNRTSSTFYPEVTPNADGSATFKYEYIRQDTFEVDISVGTIPFYDPNLPEGVEYTGLCNIILWQDTSMAPTSFLGRSDEFPSTKFDAVVLQNTPVGTYTVGINEKTYFNKNDYVPSATRPLTIIVTDDPPQTTTTTTTSTTTSTTTNTTTSTMSTESAYTTTTMTTPATTTTTSSTATIYTTTISTTTSTMTTSSKTTTTTGMELTEAPDPPYISKTRATLYKGAPLQLYVYNAEGEELNWKTTNESIASVSQDGLVTTYEAGSCRVYTIVRGKILVCTVIVKDGICGDVDISGDVSLIDAVWLSKYMAGVIKLNHASITNADCYPDGIVTGDDLTTLLAYLIQKTDVLPIEV